MAEDTIVAVATPPGRGGVGILRLSGPKAYAIAYHLNGQKELKARIASYCSFYDECGAVIDQGIMLFFKAPYSFTGEDVIECHTHGSPIVLDMLTHATLQLGARIAQPGEFSQRAFLNDKIDLVQAEAIADLIEASSHTAARLALKSLQGEFSRTVHQINEQLIHLRLYVEAAIDFPEEEIDFLNDGKVEQLLQKVITEIKNLRAQAQQGALLREGLSLVIAGKPNAGKSTLINLLCGKDLAIVTAIAGTTRDVLREHIVLDELPLQIIDTAGLRDSTDLVEQEGIKRAWQEIQHADCIVLVVDINHPRDQEALMALLAKHKVTAVPVITVFNKIDTVAVSPYSDNQNVYVSAQSGAGYSELKELIKKTVGFVSSEGSFLARRRHLQALDDTHQHLITGQQQLLQQRAGELLAEDLRQAHEVLGTITGEFSADDLLGAIFSSFCIGK